MKSISQRRLLPRNPTNGQIAVWNASTNRWDPADNSGGTAFDPTADQSISGNYNFSKPIQLAQFAGTPDAPTHGHSIYTATSMVESRFFKASGFRHHFDFSALTQSQTILIPDAGGTMVTTSTLGGYLKLGAALDSTLRSVTDYAATVSPLQLSSSQIGMNFSGVAQPIVWKASSTLTDYSGWHDNSGTYRFLTKQGVQMFVNIGYNLTFADGFSAKSYMSSTGSLGLGISSGISSRLQVAGDGINPIVKLQTSAGTATHTFKESTALEFGTQTVYIASTANGTSTSTAGRGLLFVGASGQGIHQFNFVSTNSETSGTVGGINLTGNYSVSSGSALYQPVRIAYTINNTGTTHTGTATGIFLNATETALNGMLHYLMDLQVGGTYKFRVSNIGALSTAHAITMGAGDFTVASGSEVIFLSRSRFDSPTNGNIRLRNNAGTSFGYLQFGGTTNLFASIYGASTELRFKLADGSNNSPVGASMFKAYSNSADQLGLVLDTNRVYGNGIYIGANYTFNWSSANDDMTATLDVGLSRYGAGILQVTDGSSGCGGIRACYMHTSDLTGGGLTTARPFKIGAMADVTVAGLTDLGLDKQIAFQHDGSVVYIPASTTQFT